MPWTNVTGESITDAVEVLRYASETIYYKKFKNELL